MKILVVNGHPDEQSFSAALTNKYVENIDKRKHEIEVLELGKMRFDPVLRFGYRKFMKPDQEIERSQELVKWADHIAFIYPIWWASMPSLLKGWLDRVLTPGFAFNIKGIGSVKHLTGRTAELVITCGSPTFYYKFFVRLPIKLMSKRILGFCGVKVNKTLICGNANTLSEAKRKKFLEKVAKSAKKV